MPLGGIGGLSGCSQFCNFGYDAGGLGYLLYDTFDDTNGVAMTTHTMNVGPGWTKIGTPTWEIQTNKSQHTYNGGINYLYANAGASDGTVSVVINVVSNSFEGVCFRLTDANNFWLFRMAGNANDTQLLECAFGSYYLRGSSTPALTVGNDYTFSVVLSGTSIICKIGTNTEISTTSSAQQSATRHGIGAFRTASFNNFSMV